MALGGASVFLLWRLKAVTGPFWILWLFSTPSASWNGGWEVLLPNGGGNCASLFLDQGRFFSCKEHQQGGSLSDQQVSYLIETHYSTFGKHPLGHPIHLLRGGQQLTLVCTALSIDCSQRAPQNIA